MSNREVRVRFAPSPTGGLHLGGVRTALFNYLFARKNNGKFILRIEDTDQTRFVPGAEEYIIKSLEWIGLDVDESDLKGGEYGPYKQSNRKHLYRQYAEQLVNDGFAYYAFDTPEELEDMRKKLEAEKASVQSYGPATRMTMKNSLTLGNEKTQELLNSGVQYVVRFKMPENEKLVLKDIIRGEISADTSLLDDKVLFKSDGMPTYHLANIVDDHLMKISHVIRGEEWLPSLPLHYLLYRSFGWLDTMPEFAHLPLILKPDGKGKLSKRDGDRLGFPVFPLDWTDPKTGEHSKGYKETGYLPQAFMNMMALLGWNPGNTTQEIFTKEELCSLFTLEHVNKSGSKFDPEKNKWFNKQYIEQTSNEILAEYFIEDAKNAGFEVNKEKASVLCGLVKDRAHFTHDLWLQSEYFFKAPTEYNSANVKKFWKEDSPELLSKSVEILKGIDDFTSKNMENIVSEWINSNGLSFGKVLNPMRLALAGECKGPHIFDILEQLGKQESIKRIEDGIKNIK
ncbi:MAG: glutamate--tRNA ligase [Bacteroidales bacterium]|nr:glutamate--tRNA ligase [Bacteroidales bacterium]